MPWVSQEAEQRATDAYGQKFKTVKELMAEEQAARAARANVDADAAAIAAAKAAADKARPVKVSATASLPPDKRAAVELVSVVEGQLGGSLCNSARGGHERVQLVANGRCWVPAYEKWTLIGMSLRTCQMPEVLDGQSVLCMHHGHCQ